MTKRDNTIQEAIDHLLSHTEPDTKLVSELERLKEKEWFVVVDATDEADADMLKDRIQLTLRRLEFGDWKGRKVKVRRLSP